MAWKIQEFFRIKSPIEGFSPRSEIPADREYTNERTPEKMQQEIKNLVMEGVEPLPMEKPSKLVIPLDDLPVPSPKKDFVTLLEERLREETEDEANSEKNPKTRVKRPFLKKGQGLARFKPNPNSNSTQRTAKTRRASLSANMRLSPTPVTKNNPPKLKETPRSSRACSSYGKGISATAQAKLNLKNVPLAKTKTRSKSACIDPKIKSCPAIKPRAKPPIDMNVSSDIETKSRRELEEMRIFELLEEKAENSSFCSNSSTVLALLRQSTPIKNQNTRVDNPRGKMQSGKVDALAKNHTSDSNLEEIVRSTKSNKMPGSPVTKIRETVIQKDYVISQWDTGSQNESINSSNTNRVSNRAIAAGSYKSTKHTTIQFNNNNNNSNDNYRALIDSAGTDHSNCDKHEVQHDTMDKRTTENSEPEKESANVSFHVRFSEYNEYKTIDLTDTSIMSNDVNNSRDYREDQAWSDRSTSPDSSDIEVLFSKVGKSNVSKSSDCRTKGLADASRENGQNSCDDETTDQTTDHEDEDYTSVGSNEESCDEENTTVTEIKEEEEPTRSLNSFDKQGRSDLESGNCNGSSSTIGQGNDEITSKIDLTAANDTIFKSELLKTRLAELEREIEIFRKENAAVVAQRKKLQDETRQLHKEYKMKEESLEKEKKVNEELFQEERKRLSREKAALENRLKDAREKSLLNKQERQETQLLRDQIDELKEEMNQKENRWQAAQARQKSQIRVLQTENSRLKQELEKLKASKTNNSRNRKPITSSNTRSIHLINKHLDSKKNIRTRQDSSTDEEETAEIVYGKTEVNEPLVENEDLIPNENSESNKGITHNFMSRQTSVKDDEELRKKRSLYTNLLSEATEGLRGNEQIVLGKHDKSREQLQQEMEKAEANRKWDEAAKVCYDKPTRTSSSPASKNVENTAENDHSRSPIEKNNYSSEPRRWSDVPICQNDRIKSSTIKQQDIREVQCPDGHLEYWYPNGNVKKIYPDRNIIKMIYYNGDVRESRGDGTVKYFYASTRTWHTTLPDGLEILEFPDGQVERRSKDGTNEVSFPDGALRLLQADGVEKWVLPDGTVAETFPDGNKILSFPNGQREVHTAEHKRREYPDGTVKLVYPDGTQETRYSTGRIRVKDKDGKLLMDVHHRQ
ncbi:centromere protein J isoform X2 [Venturia canescens]|uniref:centromere protein J isoform X2 n=1 Tax=Venturia canescens TaxID=32260 RepID=UPI001C9D07C1|nr:centromere protein J isoform X2 [Venturia canescens]